MKREVTLGPPPRDNEGNGWYSWLSSWVYAPTNPQTNTQTSGRFPLLATERSTTFDSHFELPDRLKDVERNLEEELIDVLNDSLDDSTVLRRDTLLAKVNLVVKSVAVTFLDESPVTGKNGHSVTKIFNGQLNDVQASLKLSPRHHLMGVDLSINDLSLISELLDSTPTDSFYDALSSMFSVGKAATLPGNDVIVDRPLLTCTYWRRAPQRQFQHNIHAEFAPVTVMYHSQAYEALLSFFDGDENIDDYPDSPIAQVKKDDYIETKICACLLFPRVSVELKRDASLTKEDESKPFACAHLNDFRLDMNKTGKDITDVSLTFGGIEVEDLTGKQQLTPILSMHAPNTQTTQLRRGKRKSESCPDLSIVKQLIPMPTPMRFRSPSIELKPSSRGKVTSSPTNLKRRASITNMTNRGKDKNTALVKITVNSAQKGESRVLCQLPQLDVRFHYESWAYLLDFLAIISPAPSQPPPKFDIQQIEPTNAWKTVVEFACGNLRLIMDKGFGDVLGAIALNNVQSTITVDNNGFHLLGTTEKAVLSDWTRHCGLYPDRLISEATDGSSLPTLTIYRHSIPDPQLQREFDMSIGVDLPSATLTHTQKYLMNLITYWMQFLQTMDALSNIKTVNSGKQPLRVKSNSARVQVKVTSGKSTLVLPVNSMSDRVLVAEIHELNLANEFLRCSQLKDNWLQNNMDEYDCLIDVMNVVCSQTTIHSGFTQTINSQSTRTNFVKTGEFESYSIVRQEENLLDLPIELVIGVERNLDMAFSHNVPDLYIHTNLSRIVCQVPRLVLANVLGLLQCNLGEDTGPPQVLPQYLQSDVSFESHDEAWVTFLFMAELQSVRLNCVWTDDSQWDSLNMGEQLAEIDLNRARLSFSVQSDSCKDIDLICHRCSLSDARYSDIAANKRNNVFPVILSGEFACESDLLFDKPPSSTSSNVTQDGLSHLMAEVHLLTPREGPPKLTVLLADCKLILIVDWINKALEFLATGNKWDDVNAKPPNCLESPKPGVITRKMSERLEEKGLDIKFNVRNCDLVMVEDQSVRNSKGIILQITCVVQLSLCTIGGASCHIDCGRIVCSTCNMSNITESTLQLTQPFSLRIHLQQKQQQTNIWKKVLSSSLLPNYPSPRKNESGFGLLEMNATMKHTLEINLLDFTARCTDKDMINVYSVLIGQLKYMDSTAKTQSNKQETPAALVLHKITLKCDCASLWVMEERLDTRFPLFKTGITDGNFDIYMDKSPWSGEGCVTVFCDYFNQRVVGFEPLVEPWNIDLATCSIDLQHRSIQAAIYSKKCPIDVTITQVFLQQLMQFVDRQSVGTPPENRAYVRAEHLPYELRNDCGSRLTWCTDSTTSKHCKWIAMPNQTTMEGHQITIAIDGWYELSPVSVDRVGTYFRLAKVTTAPQGSSLTVGATYTRVVVNVSLEPDGRKLVTVRSALTIVNSLPDPIHVRLENMTTFVGDYHDMTLASGGVSQAPLAYAHSKVYVRPRGKWAMQYSRNINWGYVSMPGEQVTSSMHSSPEDNDATNHTPYRLSVHMKREYYPMDGEQKLVGHTITIGPSFIVCNLLPVELTVELFSYRHADRVPAGRRKTFPMVDTSSNIHFGLSTDMYRWQSHTIVPEHMHNEWEKNVYLMDAHERVIKVTVTIESTVKGVLKMIVRVPHWVVNKTGLPIIVATYDGGRIAKAPGQFDEHEMARSMLPLMLAPPNSETSMSLRIGNGPEPEFEPHWTTPLDIKGVGISHRQLELHPRNKRLPPKAYSIGVELRPGRGEYKNTTVVMVTPRTQLDNRSSHTVFVAQSSQTHEHTNSHLCISPQCSLPWHWTNPNQDLLLCVKRNDLPHWSAPFQIDKIHSFLLNIRNKQGCPCFIRVEVSLVGAIYYVTLSDADKLPCPIRIENWSKVPVLYKQKGCQLAHQSAILNPNSTVDYFWDDLSMEGLLQLTVFGNKSATYRLDQLGQAQPLLYQNYFYIYMTHTHTSNDGELVFDVNPNNGIVYLNTHDVTREDQLWRMTPGGNLVNIGYTQRQDMKRHPSSQETTWVLDLVSTPHNMKYENLMLRKLDSRRESTQKWKFTEDDRLKCGLARMWAQAENRHLIVGSKVVVGATHPDSQSIPGISPEQWIQKRRQKAGSGILGIKISHEGPTRVLQIKDQSCSLQPPSPESTRGITPVIPWKVYITMELQAGLGVSLVNQHNQELIYARLQGLLFRGEKKDNYYALNCDVMQIQADNQLTMGEGWPLLFTNAKQIDEINVMPALKMEMKYSPMTNFDSFDALRIIVGKVSLRLEETLLWKLTQMFQSLKTANITPTTQLSPTHNQTQATFPDVMQDIPYMQLIRLDPTKARRCYFGHLQLSICRLYLSVETVSSQSLPPDLLSIKRQFPFTLIKFESAPVELDSFRQKYYFETLDFLIEAMSMHFTKEIRGQAVKILGSVDFLGNPIGLFQDFSGGLKELFIEGNVGGFVTNVGHGIGNSFAKVSSSLSEGLGKIIEDEEHTLRREMVRQEQARMGPNALGHLYSGVKGLGLGVYGGATSLITQTYDGAKKDGFEGGIVGAFKGAVGTVTKPLQGALDLISGASLAAKEVVGGGTGGSTCRFPASRLRVPRVCRGIHGTLPVFSHDLAMAQRMLSTIHDDVLANTEICLAVDTVLKVKDRTDTISAIVCTEKVYLLRNHEETESVVLVIAYGQLDKCIVNFKNNSFLLDFVMKSRVAVENKAVKCTNKEVADGLRMKIHHAKQQFDDLKRSLPVPEDFTIQF